MGEGGGMKRNLVIASATMATVFLTMAFIILSK